MPSVSFSSTTRIANPTTGMTETLQGVNGSIQTIAMVSIISQETSMMPSSNNVSSMGTSSSAHLAGSTITRDNMTMTTTTPAMAPTVSVSNSNSTVRSTSGPSQAFSSQQTGSSFCLHYLQMNPDSRRYNKTSISDDIVIHGRSK
jgi:hypothetical protein